MGRKQARGTVTEQTQLGHSQKIGSKKKLESDPKADYSYDLPIAIPLKIKNSWVNEHLNRVEVNQY